MSQLTTDFSKDQDRINAQTKYHPKPWSVVAGVSKGHEAWVIHDANGKVIEIKNRGIKLLIVNAINAYGVA